MHIGKADVFRSLVTILGVFLSLSGAALGTGLHQPMTFTVHEPCEGTGSVCNPYILAQGTIVSTTPNDFLRYVKNRKFKPQILFDSPGGNLAAGLQLGRLIRQFKMDTYIGGPSERLMNEIVPEPICFSACAYAFLGGVIRNVEDGGRFGVHRFRGSAKDRGEAVAQVTTTVLSAYLDEMGVDRQFLDLASLTPANQIRLLTPQEARLLNVDNTDQPLSAWRLEADAHGRLALVTAQKQAFRDGTVVLAVYRVGDAMAATLWYRTTPQGRSIGEVKEVFSQPTRFYLRVGQHTFTLQPKSAWAPSRGGFQISLDLPTGAIHAISQARSFDLDAEWANAYRDLNPSATFGTEGFRNGAAALMRPY